MDQRKPYPGRCPSIRTAHNYISTSERHERFFENVEAFAQILRLYTRGPYYRTPPVPMQIMLQSAYGQAAGVQRLSEPILGTY